MSSISPFSAFDASLANISMPNSGFNFGRSDDSVTAHQVQSVGTHFTQSVNPVTSNPIVPQRINPEPFSGFSIAQEFQALTPRSLPTAMTFSSTGLHPVPLVQYGGFFEGIEDIPLNANAIDILSATTQYQARLMTEGQPAGPGYPVPNLGNNPDALAYMGRSEAFINSTVQAEPYGNQFGVSYPGYPNVNNFYPNATLYPQYTLPGQNPLIDGITYPPYPQSQMAQSFPPQQGNPYGYPTQPMMMPQSGFPQYPSYASQFPAQTQSASQPSQSYLAFPETAATFFPTPAPIPGSSQMTSTLINTIANNPFQLPDYIPSNWGPFGMMNQFNQLNEQQRVQVRQTYANPTTVNQQILGQTGITSKGGRYNQGVVTNPFNTPNFLQDTNPFQRFNTGLVVTNGNGNGKVKGTPVKDIIRGSDYGNNVIDGQGGEDDIFSPKQALINLHPGDQVTASGSENVFFCDLTQPNYTAKRVTAVNGGPGNNVMVLTVNGDPTLPQNTPVFRNAGGFLNVNFNGLQILTQNVNRFIVVDTQGNIGGVYDSTQQYTGF